MNIYEIHDLAKKYDRRLKATDKRFRRVVHITHRDGSSFFFESAFLATTGKWIVVFSEHHNFHVYHKEDLIRWGQYKKIKETEKVK